MLSRTETGPRNEESLGRTGVSPSDDPAGRKNMLLLIQLRWIAVAGQIATIVFVERVLGMFSIMLTILRQHGSVFSSSATAMRSSFASPTEGRGLHRKCSPSSASLINRARGGPAAG